MLETGTEKTEKIPLRKDRDGTVRVASSGVTLDVVLHAYDEGATPEEIVQKFGELRLDDVYAVLTYYLRHSEEVRSYLAEREDQAKTLRKKAEAHHLKTELRERLLRRKAERQGS